jgi:hypothetical protein
MPAERIQVAGQLNATVSLQLAADLNLLQPESDVVLDFTATRHFEPFSMLLVSSAANRLRARLRAAGKSLEIPTAGLDPDGIAAHMGFWRSMGAPLGREVNAPAGRDTYLPVTRLGVDELYREAGGADPLAAGVIEQRAQALAMVLAQPRSTELVEALTYAFRELIRNVLEHAMTPAVWIAGMSWPKRDFVQVAVLDEGRGIRRSLADNPECRVESDLEALRLALRPGISRNAGKEPTDAQRARWAEEGHRLPIEMFRNAGYGLHMVSSLCRAVGQFLIASGTGSLSYIGGAEVQSSTAHPGTALRLVLQPSEVPAEWEQLFARVGNSRKPLLSASTLKRLGLDSLSAKLMA